MSALTVGVLSSQIGAVGPKIQKGKENGMHRREEGGMEWRERGRGGDGMAERGEDGWGWNEGEGEMK